MARICLPPRGITRMCAVGSVIHPRVCVCGRAGEMPPEIRDALSPPPGPAPGAADAPATSGAPFRAISASSSEAAMEAVRAPYISRFHDTSRGSD
eukprot:SAG25_NODE_44_length_19254_cov_246.998121_27_plen_95_part_00